MDNSKNTVARPGLREAGTYDLASPAERLEAIDLAMRHYFQADDWLTVRNEQSPGRRPGL